MHAFVQICFYSRMLLLDTVNKIASNVFQVNGCLYYPLHECKHLSWQCTCIRRVLSIHKETVHEYCIYSVSWEVAEIIDQSLEFVNQVAWFAVGCYYLLVGKNDPARRYFR